MNGTHATPMASMALTLALALTMWPALAAAQATHRGAGHPGTHPQHPGTHPQGPGAGQPTPAQIRRMEHERAAMQRQYEAEQRIYLQQQAEHARRMQQAHEEHMRRFTAHLEASGGQPGGEGMPTTPDAFRRWEKAQKHKKATKQRYDPAYDRYREFEASLAEDRPARKAARPRREPAPAAAKPPARTAAKPGDPEVRKPIPPHDQAIIHHLRFVHEKLREADHDYDGHRARALRHVGQAIHHLGPTSRMGVTVVGDDGDDDDIDGPGGLTQSRSDGLLRESLNRLETAEKQLSARSASEEHHAHARTEVAQAIAQVRVALSVR